ncbi:MAG: MBL fold metallo-hydrolase [Actinobacteria bacterium]|nr:MBL fold metallo-hydrolase [Actinomycetota bacterium]
MFFREILNEDLGCGSYIVADGNEAAVVDPKWETEEYLQIAEDNGFKIPHILETHNHADHLSGKGRLVEATGATIHISKDAGVEYEHEPLDEGDVISPTPQSASSGASTTTCNSKTRASSCRP